MANSLRAKLSKLRHDGHITDAEYQAFIKKLDGRDREIRAKAIDEFAERYKKANVTTKVSERIFKMLQFREYDFQEITQYIDDLYCNLADEIAEELKGGAE